MSPLPVRNIDDDPEDSMIKSLTLQNHMSSQKPPNIIRISNVELEKSKVGKFIDFFHESLQRVRSSIEIMSADLEKFSA